MQYQFVLITVGRSITAYANALWRLPDHKEQYCRCIQAAVAIIALSIVFKPIWRNGRAASASDTVTVFAAANAAISSSNSLQG